MSPAPESPGGYEERIGTLEYEAAALRSELDAAGDRVEREKRRALTLAWAARLVNSSLELDVVLRTVIDLAVETMKAERGFLMLADAEGKLEFAVARNLDRHELSESDLQISQGIAKEVFERGRSVVTTDAQRDGRFAASHSIAGQGIRSIVCVPLTIKERALGIVYLDSRLTAGLFSRQDPELLLTFANQAAIAIENARLFEQQQARLHEIERLESLHASILNSITSGVITVSNSGEITSFNEAAGTTFGVDPKTMLGKPVRALDAFVFGIANAIERFAVGSGLELSQEMTVEHPERGTLTLEIKIVPLHPRQGAAVAIADLTEQRALLRQHEESLRQSKLIEQSFSRYLAPHVVQSLIRHPENVQLGGERQTATILFADIRDFTSMSTKIRAEDVVELLNRYFEAAVGVVFENDGLLDKFYGDGLMAVFGPPLARHNDAARAVHTAIKLQAEAARLAPSWPYPFRIGVGLATGEVVAGNVGSSRRTDYTVIGDAVNLASRLQAAAPGGAVYLDERTYVRCGLNLRAERMSARVKGHDEDVTVYALRT